jgi:translation initiation factor IF-3
MKTKQKTIVANEQITSRTLRVIDENGAQIGVVSKNTALNIAQEAGMDLILVSDTVDPPLCKLGNLDKFKYDQQKAAKTKRKMQSASSTLKEVYLRPVTGVHDIETKVNQITKFLEKNFTVKVGVKFRKRERNMSVLGKGILEQVLAGLGEHASIKQEISQQANIMAMTLVSSHKDK